MNQKDTTIDNQIDPKESVENPAANLQISKSPNFQILLSAILWSGVVSIIIFGSASLPGYDSYYHIKMAEMMKNGLWVIDDFHWTTCSIWSSPFFNKEWLFHVYLVPFVLIFGKFTGAKVAIVLTVFMIALAWGGLLKTLKIQNILFAMLFMLFFTGYIYPGRLVLCRSFLLSIFLMPIVLNCVLNKKRVLLVITLYIYMLSYVGAWQMLPIIFLFDIFNFKRAFKEKRLLKDLMLSYSLAGIFLGLILSPYFPVNIKAIFTQTILIIKAQWFGVEGAGTLPMGSELAPISRKHLICYIPLFLIFGFAVYDLFKRKLISNIKPESKAFFIITTLYLILTIFTQKFIEYLAPLFTILVFNLWSQHPHPYWNNFCFFYKPKTPLDSTLANTRKTFLISLLITIGLLSTYLLRESFYKKHLLYSDSAEWIKNNIKKDSLIFTGDWDDNVVLFYHLPEYRFLVMLDPYFMYAKSADKFRVWNKIANGKVEDSANAIKTNFKTKTVFVPPDRQRLRHKLLMNDGAKLVYDGNSGESVFILE